jgi:hypothetical protein
VTDLATWLLDRIAEDEAVARAAGSGPWQWEQGFGDMCNDPECPFGSLTQVKEDGQLYELMDVHGYDVHADWEGAEHIARHDPARVLAECAAKRRIVAECATQIEDEVTSGAITGIRVLRLLALPYADHDGYDPSWGVQ